MANTLNTEILGVHPSDVIIRTAIIAALNDLRANPWLLNYAFAGLGFDTLTAAEYGENEIARAKEWFSRTNIPVVWNIGVNDPKFPCISIALMSSQEVEQEGTLGDTHYQPFETNNWGWPVLVGPVTPTSYNRVTGVMALDPKLVDVVLAPGMVVVTATGKQYPITDVLDVSTFTIAAGAADNFDAMSVKTANPAFVTEIESAVFREVYGIGCHVDSEPVHLTYLHSVLVFILRRYNQALLEARGFERSTIASTDFKREDDALPEFLYSRYIQITGSVRQSWPKTVAAAANLVVTVDVENMDDTQEDEDGATAGSLIPPIIRPSRPVYWGAATVPGTINAAFITGLSSSVMANSRQATLSFNAGVGQYCWYATPVAFAGTPQDFIDEMTALEVGVSDVAVVAVGAGLYNVWRTNQPGLGALTILVT